MISPDIDKKLFLIDAYALIFRAYFAFIKNPRVNSKGQNTSSAFGFTNALIDVIKNESIQLVVNTTEGKQAITDSFSIRRESLQNKATYCTTIAGAKATIDALADITVKEVRELNALQSRHERT